MPLKAPGSHSGHGHQQHHCHYHHHDRSKNNRQISSGLVTIRYQNPRVLECQELNLNESAPPSEPLRKPIFRFESFDDLWPITARNVSIVAEFMTNLNQFHFQENTSAGVLMFWITVLFHDSHHLMVRHSAQAVAKKLERFRHIHTSYSSWSIAGRGDCSTCFLLSGSSPRLLSSRVRQGWWFKGYVRFVETRTNVGPFYSWGRFYQLASAHAYKRDGNCSSGKMLVRTIHGNGVIYHPNG